MSGSPHMRHSAGSDGMILLLSFHRNERIGARREMCLQLSHTFCQDVPHILDMACCPLVRRRSASALICHRDGFCIPSHFVGESWVLHGCILSSALQLEM